MLGADFPMAQAFGLVMGETEHAAGAGGKPFKIVGHGIFLGEGVEHCPAKIFYQIPHSHFLRGVKIPRNNQRLLSC